MDRVTPLRIIVILSSLWKEGDMRERERGERVGESMGRDSEGEEKEGIAGPGKH